MSSPSGARIIVDGKPTGFRTPTSFPLAAGAHSITLSLAGHRNAQENVRLGPGDTLQVEAALTPLAAGSLSVGSVPGGAQVFIDGAPFNRRTPTVIPQLAIGTHTVQLRLEGCEDWSQAVVVTQSQPAEIRARLTPSRQSLGTLAVQSQPPRAAITLDGFPTGKLTPERFAGIAPGSHRVELVREGHRLWSGTAVVREGHTENLLVALRQLPAEKASGARIETDPPGASLTLNGIALRQKTPTDLVNLAAGVLPLEITRPGSRPWKGELTLQPGKHALLKVRLEPEGLYGGSIRVESEPSGAAVAVDGAPAESPTPTLLTNLTPAGHRVEVALPGFHPWVRVVQVGEGTIDTVRARLIPHPYTITATVEAWSTGAIDMLFSATAADDTPATGVLELDATASTGSWRNSRLGLVDGRARGTLAPAAAAAAISFSVELGPQRAVFLLRRDPDGWKIASPE